MRNTNTGYRQSIERELEKWPGVSVHFQNGGRHERAVLQLGAASRFVTLPRSPSDWRGSLNALSTIRRELEGMGAERIRKRGGNSPKGDGVGRFAINRKSMVFAFPETSPVFAHVADAEHKPRGHWTVELRAAVALDAPPHVVLKRVESPEPGKRKVGAVSGYFNPALKALTLAFGHSVSPALALRGPLGAGPLKLRSGSPEELVFDVVAWAPETEAEAVPEPDASPRLAIVPAVEPPPEPEATSPAVVDLPLVRAERAADPEPPAGAQALQPVQLTLPREKISLERAVDAINQYKAKLGHNLKLHVSEGGFLAVTAKLGRF